VNTFDGFLRPVRKGCAVRHEDAHGACARPAGTRDAIHRSMSPEHSLSRASVVIAALLVASCSSGSSETATPTPTPTSPIAVTAAIRASEGGTVEHPEGARLVIPAGALSQDATLQVALYDGGHQLEFSSTTFAAVPPRTWTTAASHATGTIPVSQIRKTGLYAITFFLLEDGIGQDLKTTEFPVK
jgi:hypothetical protein